MRRCLSATIFIILLTVSLQTIVVNRVVAPPLIYGYTCGLITSLDSDIHLSHVKVNTTIIPYLVDGENLTHQIEVLSSVNLTNTADHEVSYLVSNVRSSWTPILTYESIPDNITIEGNPALYNISVVYGFSTLAELPEEIGSRFSSDFFTEFFDPQIDVVNITLATGVELVLSVKTILVTKCLGNAFDFRYGLDVQKFNADSADIEGKLEVTNTSPYVRTDLLNSYSLSASQIGVSLVASWAISDWNWVGEITYPGQQFNEDVFSDYIGVQLWQSEYGPPTLDYDPIPDFVPPPLYFTVTLIALFIFLIAVLRSKKY